MKKVLASFALLPVLVMASLQAHAAVSADVLAAISTAQADALSVAGILTAMVAVIWGALFIKRKFFGG